MGKSFPTLANHFTSQEPLRSFTPACEIFNLARLLLPLHAGNLLSNPFASSPRSCQERLCQQRSRCAIALDRAPVHVSGICKLIEPIKTVARMFENLRRNFGTLDRIRALSL